MAYLIFIANGEEIDRRELREEGVIGRAGECEICIRDIMMSRRHCRIEREGERWVLIDLGSRNGTYLGQERIERRTLGEGDELRLGRTRMVFCAGAYEPAPRPVKSRLRRPVDPGETLTGTLSGFALLEPGEADHASGLPVPQPRPPEPRSYDQDDVYGMLNELVSSSWDSIYQQASRPIRGEAPKVQVMVRPREKVSISLQAKEEAPRAESRRGAWLRNRFQLNRGERRALGALLSLASFLLIASACLLITGDGPSRTIAAESHQGAPLFQEQAVVASETAAPERELAPMPLEMRDDGGRWSAAAEPGDEPMDPPPSPRQRDAALRLIVWALFVR